MDPYSNNVDPFFLHQPDLSWELDSSQQQQQQYSQAAMSPSNVSSQQYSHHPASFMSFQQQQQQQQQQPPHAAFSMGAAGPSSIAMPDGMPQHIVPLSMISSQAPQQPHAAAMLTPEQQAVLSGAQAAGAAPAAVAVDANGQPVKIRKKPGRKPNPASPAVRKAQNRAAQRAFRERKERHLRDLENTIRTLRDQRNHATKELGSIRAKLDGYKAENWYLKGVVLTLQFVCLHHNIQIPTHSPYLTEEALNDMARTSPHAIEAYVNAYTRNNIDLKPMMASQFANMAKNDDTGAGGAKQCTEDDQHPATTVATRPESVAGDSGSYGMFHDTDSVQTPATAATVATPMDAMDDVDDGASATTGAHTIKTEPSDHQLDALSPPPQQQQQQQQQPATASSSLSAIQQIRLQLRVQSTLSRLGKSSVRLQPTLLQLAIPHDPRIDLIPTPHMRDRMIIFRDLMDYDRCFSMLLNGAVYHGGDATMSDSWELPADFFSEFWYLATNYDYSKTNKWRRLKGLPEVELGPKEIHDEDRAVSPIDQYLWADELSEPMPSLQPMMGGPQDARQRSMSPSQHSASSPSHPLYESLRSPPELRSPVQSVSIDVMMDLMSHMSTTGPP